MQLWGGVVYLSILGGGFGGDCTEGRRAGGWSHGVRAIPKYRQGMAIRVLDVGDNGGWG